MNNHTAMKGPRYSEELSQVLKKKPTWIMMHGISLIFIVILIALSLSNYVKAPLSLRATAVICASSIEKKDRDDHMPGTYSAKVKDEIPQVVLVKLIVSSDQTKHINAGQLVLFKGLQAKGIINSIVDIDHKKDHTVVFIILKPYNDLSLQVLTRATMKKTEVNILYEDKSLYERLFNLNRHNN